MIKLKNVHKYFNKNRNNEIHVINDTSIEFPEKGLVAITGPSGCGKTTLLNVIAGLDSFKGGEISYDGKTVHKYKSSLIDSIRNRHIGFVFQNYHLLPDKTVYDNIKTSLNIAGLYDKDRIEERINYSLEQVGMYNYRKRNVLALSGGQQQRVGIARAIAKNPDVILADEPTGNLDSNNTFAIMSLIKNISQNKLVILVTHERHLVDFYADRIIELKDGVVTNDYQNFNNQSYDHKDERLIYLKDLQKEDLKTDFIEYYYNQESKKQFNIKIVEMNDTLYIQTNADKKVTFIDDESEIKLIDEHKKEIKVEDLEPLDFEKFKPIESHHQKSLFRWRETFLAGFKKFFAKRKFTKKLMVFAYFVISGLIVLQLASLGNLIRVNESDFLDAPKNFVAVNTNEPLTRSELLEIHELDGVSVPYVNITYISITSQTFYQTRFNAETDGWIVRSSWVEDPDMVVGRMPINTYEIVISYQLAENALGSQFFTASMGINDPEDLIGAQVRLDEFDEESTDLEIVGILDSEEELAIVADDTYPIFVDQLTAYSSYDLYENDIELVDGRMPIAEDEIIVVASGTYDLGDTVTIQSRELQNIGTYDVVGTYQATEDANKVVLKPLVSDAEYARLYLQDIDIYFSYYRSITYYVQANDKTVAISDLEDLGYEAADSYEQAREAYINNRNLEISSRLVTLFVIIGGIILYIYFVTRTSMINRIKEIGIYRAIGATKRDVYKIFLSEILVYTTLASVTGYLISSYILRGIENQVEDFISFFYLPWWLFGLGLLGIYVINVIFGILPVFTLLRKTPAEILAKYDI